MTPAEGRSGPPVRYLDHAATAFPKAPGVSAAVASYLDDVGANPGRSGHRLSLEAARLVFRCREAVARLFNSPRSERVVFTQNVTEALNLVLFGTLREGDHVVTTEAEHNALMRPLRHLERTRRVEVTRVPTAPDGDLDPAALHRALRPTTRLVALLHASNVTGVVRDLEAIVRAKGDVPLLLDVAQSAGAVPIDLVATPVEFLAFTGHKGLLGPTGTGGLVIAPGHVVEPLHFGGTGSNSEHEEQPEHLPDRLESGTPNVAGIAGLLAALTWLRSRTVEAVFAQERATAELMYARLAAVPSLQVHGPQAGALRLPTVSVTFKFHDPGQAALRLDREHGVMVRQGLHCAPSAHRMLGTFPGGTVRLSAGPLLSPDDLEAALAAVSTVAET